MAQRGGRVGCVVGGGEGGSQNLGLSLSNCVPGAGRFIVLSSVTTGEEQSSPQWAVDGRHLWEALRTALGMVMTQ